MYLILFLGVIVFLIMELPAIFWLAAVPLGIILLIRFISWLKK